jgi:16S rRNA (guanine966-N2)-methyltransferase
MRITGGLYRSRAIRAPRGQATRPTSDRVREALFGILASAGRVSGARVLDLYAGTGALALEALSRGAADATLVESGRDALDVARANVASLGVQDRVRVVAANVTAATAAGLLGRHGPFDLVLADPPWALVDEGRAGAALAALVASAALAPAAMVVLEHSSRTPAPDIEGLERVDTRRYGDAALAFYKPAILPGPRSERPDSSE